MENKKPKISVVMPNYNNEKYIQKSIESILNQSFNNFEFIIVDDFSNDGSWKIINSYSKKDLRIKALRNIKNLGVSESLNKAIKIASGEYISIMHSDDIAKPDKLEVQNEFLDNNKKTGLIGSYIEIIDTKGSIINNCMKKPTNHNKIIKNILKYTPVVSPTFFFRKKILNKIGFFDENLRMCEDIDFIIRVIINDIKIANIDKILHKYRISETQSSNNKRKETIIFYKIYKKYKKYFKINFSDKTIIYSKIIIGLVFPRKVSIIFENLYKKIYE